VIRYAGRGFGVLQTPSISGPRIEHGVQRTPIREDSLAQIPWLGQSVSTGSMRPRPGAGHQGRQGPRHGRFRPDLRAGRPDLGRGFPPGGQARSGVPDPRRPSAAPQTEQRRRDRRLSRLFHCPTEPRGDQSAGLRLSRGDGLFDPPFAAVRPERTLPNGDSEPMARGDRPRIVVRAPLARGDTPRIVIRAVLARGDTPRIVIRALSAPGDIPRIVVRAVSAPGDTPRIVIRTLSARGDIPRIVIRTLSPSGAESAKARSGPLSPGKALIWPPRVGGGEGGE
jgi:hypothetical protein